MLVLPRFAYRKEGQVHDKRILVIDDDAELCAEIVEILETVLSEFRAIYDQLGEKQEGG